MVETSIDLECGTSLAELEYATELDQKDRQNEEKKEYSLFEGENQRNGTSTVDDITDLIRSSLANDTVTNGDVQLFTSPFETPTARYSTGQTNIPEAERYTPVPLIYCDQTASNRPLNSIERFIHDKCLPLYANSHTNTSVTGSQSTAFVAEARQVVAECVNAKITGKASLDVVLFAGNGTTSSVELLVDCLGIKNYKGNEDERPVVFVGPYEHHSNLLPWRESGCEIIMIPECAETEDVDVAFLEATLRQPKYGRNRFKMGTFTAASNVTGKISDVNKISAILHKYGALAFFDYATGAPYLSMDMNPPPSEIYSSSAIAKDAIFISPHKMIGGVNTPGLLVLKKKLVNQTNAPNRSGGGTVFYVTHTHHRFLSNRNERYEGGTPNVVGIMRVGLTFLLKRKVEAQYKRLVEKSQRPSSSETIPKSIMEHDCWTHSYVVEILKKTAPNLYFLGTAGKSTKKNLPIFSFLVKCGKRFLHYNYVCALLNDLFGIQSRGGCQCSGPYGQRLLGLTTLVDGKEVPNEVNTIIENALLHYKEKAELLRPDYSRLSLPFKGLKREEVDYVIKALEWVSKHGWALICQYRCNHRTGEWRHFSRQGKPLGRSERRWLSHYDMSYGNNGKGVAEPVRDGAFDGSILEDTMKNADYQLEVSRTEQKFVAQALKMSDENEILGDNEDLEKLRWYVYPRECAQVLSQGQIIVPETYSAEILGAIRPIGFFEPVRNVGAQTNLASANTQVATTMDEEMQPTEDTNSEVEDKESLYPFRDGEEHAGVACFDEIYGGFNDGELSDSCLVFSSEHDEWLPIERFLKTRKRAKSDDENGTEKMEIDKSSALPDGRSINQQKFVQHEEKYSIPSKVDKSREKKKPSRDSSAWGKTNSIAIPKSFNNDVGSEKHHEIRNNVPSNKSNKRKKYNHVKPPPKLMKYVIQGIMQFDMIEEGDRLLLGLSGGKDSLSLLHCLLELKRKLPTKFEIEVCTIDPMTPSFDPSPLIPYVESLGLKYHYVKDNIVDRANSGGKNGTIVTSLCAYCARMKRGNLYSCARKNACNKLVLAQHLDDCAESCFMSMMHNGFIRTMKAKYEINAGDLTVIRPMVYCRESLMTEFAKSNSLPVINENCPACFEEPKERARVKKLLSREETLYPNIYDNIRRSLIPIMHDDLQGILRCYTEEAVSKSRKNNKGQGKRKNREQTSDVVKNKNETTEVMEKADIIDPSKVSHSQALSDFTDKELVKEVARRKAHKFRLAGAMKRLDDDEDRLEQAKKECGEPSV